MNTHHFPTWVISFHVLSTQAKMGAAAKGATKAMVAVVPMLSPFSR